MTFLVALAGAECVPFSTGTKDGLADRLATFTGDSGCCRIQSVLTRVECQSSIAAAH
jgi:hypothetical protein